MSDLQQRLRRAADTLRRTSMPLADLIPLLQQAADALEAQPAQAVRSKLGAGVPMRGDDIYRIARRLAPKVVDGMVYVPEWIVPLVRAVEESHGIVGKEGA